MTAWLEELTIVPAERHVERLARGGQLAETRSSLRARLLAALVPDVAFADRRECRLVLGMALSDAEAVGTGQLGLFGGVLPEATDAKADPLLETLRARGGASWERMISALDDAIGVLRTRGATAQHLDKIARTKGFLGARARTLATAMRALDARLLHAGSRDERLGSALLAEAIVNAKASQIEELLRCRRLRTRWLHAWEPSDLAWWRALDDKLAPRGGGARIVLPSFDRPLEGSRERDPLETLADEIARGLDAPPESETIAPVLGDLIEGGQTDGGPSSDPSRVTLISASDASSQARAATNAVLQALAEGAAIERVVVALPVIDESTAAPLRRALEEAGIPVYEANRERALEAPVIAGALLALDAATSLDRRTVARLLRSGWLEASRLTGDARRDAELRIRRMASVLEGSATAGGDDAAERLVRTATTRRQSRTMRGSDDERADHERDVAVITRLVTLFAPVRAAATRIEHVRATRLLWSELGFGARAGRGGLLTFASDAPPTGVARAMRLAIARDVRAWEALAAALDLVETIGHRVAALDQPIDPAAFRLELLSLLDADLAKPGAGRAASVRISRVADVAGDDLDLLVILDANEGLLPRDDTHDALVSGVARRGDLEGEPRRSWLRKPALSARASSRDSPWPPPTRSAWSSRGYAKTLRARPSPPSPVVSSLERRGVPITLAAAVPAVSSGVDVRLRVARERTREAFFLDPARPRSDLVGDLVPSSEIFTLLASDTGGSDRALAVTGLERLARCAFMGYAHVVLGARASDVMDELPDAREEGTLIHEALAAAFVETGELWARRPRPAEEILARGESAARGVLDRWQGHAPLRAVVRLRVRDAVRAVLAVSLEDETWDFSLAEQPFGARSAKTWPALSLVAEDVRLLLRGSIDRVDRAHDGKALRVIDYKRSKTTVSGAATSLGETALQVPLYACVASRSLGLRATGAYVPVQARDASSKPNAKAAARMDDLVARPADGGLAEIERRALAVVAGIRAGGLVPAPANESECRFCEVSGGCRKPRFAMAPATSDEEG